jgi:hypothetical protein
LGGWTRSQGCGSLRLEEAEEEEEEEEYVN